MLRPILTVEHLLAFVLASLALTTTVQSAILVDAASAVIPAENIFPAVGVIEKIESTNGIVVVRHQAISNYMAAMTMPFTVKDTNELAVLTVGDQISFQLHVTEADSWIDRIASTGKRADVLSTATQRSEAPVVVPRHPLLDFKFTNELGQAVSLSDFRGQALGITFFFTRCPIPNFCPRLSKNFEEVSEKLSSMTNSPTNWHLLSVSFDPEFDTPEVLKAYAETYHYNSARWSFLTGPKEQIDELANESGVEVFRDGGNLNHNFRTLIIDASGKLQTAFPVGGDLSLVIINEMLKACAVTNQVSLTSVNSAEIQR